jgi:ribose transport system permease protein
MRRKDRALEEKSLEAGKTPNMYRYLAVASLVILYIVFAIFGRKFFSVETFFNILGCSYFIGFMAIGVTFVIITGGIDLSVGTIMMCGSLIGGMAYNWWHFPIALALLVSLAVPTLFGLMNGVMVAKLKLPPFIATLGTMMISMGFGAIVSNVMTQRYPTVADPDGWFKFVFYKTPGIAVAPGAVHNWPVIGPVYDIVLQMLKEGIPTGALWLALFAVAAVIVLNKTRLGRYTYAMGSNEEATRLSGVKVDNWKIIVYTLCGFYAGMASIAYSAAYTSIIPSTGNGLELLAIAGVVIGGTSLSGGIGTLSGTIIGVFLMSVLKQGLMSLGLQPQWQTFFTGIVVVLAVLLDIFRNTRASKAKTDRLKNKTWLKFRAKARKINTKEGIS